MNELEQRLRDALRDAVPDPAVPAGIVRAAACRAVRVRQRRVAARGALGAVTVVAGGVMLSPVTRRSAPLPDLRSVDPVVSAPAMSPTGLRVVARATDCEPVPTDGMLCRRTDVEVVRAGDTVDEFAFQDVYQPGEQPRPWDIHTLVAELADGSTQTVTARDDGRGGWIFDLDVPSGAVIVRMSFVNDAGRTVAELRRSVR